jgi:hypothetical protein
MKNPAENQSVSDMKIEMYCQSVEKLLNNITKKTNSRGNKREIKEEYDQLDDDFDDLFL